VGAELTDGFLRIAVKDQGVGIPPDLLPLIFEKYTRGNNSNQGGQRSYGLGLAFCKMAVETHGGKTGAISDLGKGSEIWFTLPLASSQIDETTDHTQSPLLSDLLDLPEFSENELNYLREHYGSIRQLSIHQISDIKDLLNKADDNTFAGISLWKKAVITSINQYDSLSFNQLINLLVSNDE
jgi:hypothetical protein